MILMDVRAGTLRIGRNTLDLNDKGYNGSMRALWAIAERSQIAPQTQLLPYCDTFKKQGEAGVSIEDMAQLLAKENIEVAVRPVVLNDKGEYFDATDYAKTNPYKLGFKFMEETLFPVLTLYSADCAPFFFEVKMTKLKMRLLGYPRDTAPKIGAGKTKPNRIITFRR